MLLSRIGSYRIIVRFDYEQKVFDYEQKGNYDSSFPFYGHFLNKIVHEERFLTFNLLQYFCLFVRGILFLYFMRF